MARAASTIRLQPCGRVVLAGLGLAAILVARPAAAAGELAGGAAGKSTSAGEPAGRPLNDEARGRIVARILRHPRIAARVSGHRVRAVRVTAGSGRAAGRPRTVATVVLFDYTTGTASRVVMDLGTGVVVRDQALPGRPQASQEERAEAEAIVNGDPDLAALVQAGGVVDGGFIVDGPRQAGPPHRVMQLMILSPDRHALQRVVHVDLTARRILPPPGMEARGSRVPAVPEAGAAAARAARR